MVFGGLQQKTQTELLNLAVVVLQHLKMFVRLQQKTPQLLLHQKTLAADLWLLHHEPLFG